MLALLNNAFDTSILALTPGIPHKKFNGIP